jgi:hypothetical protein
MSRDKFRTEQQKSDKENSVSKNNVLVRVDNIKWWETENNGSRTVVPLCPQHNLRLTPKITHERYTLAGITKYRAVSGDRSTTLICQDDGTHQIELPREFSVQKSHVINKIDSRIFSELKTITLDDEIIPVAKEELKNSDYWVRAKVTESKSGTRLIVWAGSKKEGNKAQLFVEPELKRLSFDQNDDHPLDIFAKVEATFRHDTTITMKDNQNTGNS